MFLFRTIKENPKKSGFHVCPSGRLLSVLQALEVPDEMPLLYPPGASNQFVCLWASK